MILIIQEVTLSASGTPLENIKQITYNVPNFNTSKSFKVPTKN
jgi:hypothetical protein